MTRYIICMKCRARIKPMHPEDVAMGIHRRVVELAVKRPEGHGVTVDGEHVEMPEIMCDWCNDPIHDGETALAVTNWNVNLEYEPMLWEEEFLTA